MSYLGQTISFRRDLLCFLFTRFFTQFFLPNYIFCKRFPMCVRPSYLPVQLTRQDQRRGNAERKTNAIGSLHPFSNQKRKETLTWLLTETSRESSQGSWATLKAVQLTCQDQRQGNAERKTIVIGSPHPFSKQRKGKKQNV